MGTHMHRSINQFTDFGNVTLSYLSLSLNIPTTQQLLFNKYIIAQ